MNLCTRKIYLDFASDEVIAGKQPKHSFNRKNKHFDKSQPIAQQHTGITMNLEIGSGKLV